MNNFATILLKVALSLAWVAFAVVGLIAIFYVTIIYIGTKESQTREVVLANIPLRCFASLYISSLVWLFFHLVSRLVISNEVHRKAANVFVMLVLVLYSIGMVAVFWLLSGTGVPS